VTAPRPAQVCRLPLSNHGLDRASRAAYLACAQVPTVICLWRRPPFPEFYLGSRRSTFPLTGPRLTWAYPHGCGCGSALAWSASYPCPFRPDRAPWPPSLLRQALNVTSVSPGILGFPRCYAAPTKSSLSFRLPASREARIHGSRGCIAAACSVCTQPLSIRPWTVPPDRLHPCVRNPIV
jgi:hypothetical protein